jgi:hypothetical protein
MTVVKGTVKDPAEKAACVRSLIECLRGNMEAIISGESNE